VAALVPVPLASNANSVSGELMIPGTLPTISLAYPHPRSMALA